MNAGLVELGTPEEGTCFPMCICRTQHVTRYCGKNLIQQSARSLTLGCSSVLCWQNLLDFGTVVWFLLIVFSLSPCASLGKQ